MLIRRLKPNSLLSFGPDFEGLDLLPLNVLIGPNGSGKSNFIDAIALLQGVPHDVTESLREGGGLHAWLWQQKAWPPVATVEAIVDFRGPPEGPSELHYRFAFTDLEGALQIVDESLKEESRQGRRRRETVHFLYRKGLPVAYDEVGKERRVKLRDRQQSLLAARRDPERYAELTWLADQFSEMAIYRDWTLGRRTRLRMPSATDLPRKRLLEDASNYGLVLDRFRRDPDVWQRLLEHLGELYEGIQGIETEIVGNTVQVFLREGSRVIPAIRLSDGTLRWLYLLLILLDPAPPPLVCIEEPELGLHPDLLPRLAELLRDAATRTQLVVTTHSDRLVDAFTGMPESIVVCEKRGGSTVMQRLSGEDLGVWLGKYTLGQLWTRGDLGGNRW
jgi:predicted ATPase